MVSTFAELFLNHGAAAFDQQLCLVELLGEHTWWFDMEAGTLKFNEALTSKSPACFKISTSENW
jgi:hypothetical protein